MVYAGWKLPTWGILTQATLLAVGGLAYGESSRRPTAETARRSDNSVRLYEIDDVDGIFGNNSDPTFVGSGLRLAPSRRRENPDLLFQQIRFEVPPEPYNFEQPPPNPEYDGGWRDESATPPYVGNPNPDLMPIQEDYQSTPCETCEPLFGGLVKDDCCYEVSNLSHIARFFGMRRALEANHGFDIGIGHERVVFAPFEIEPTQPTNFMMVRWDSGFGLRTPDRAEYFFSKPGKGPDNGVVNPINSIDYQDLRFITESGTDIMSVQTEIPVRFIEPDSGPSNSGLGDMRVTTKTRLVNGKKWQVTQIFGSYFNTGKSTKGVGTGHISLEPGVLARYELRPDTYIHGEVRYWIPIAGDPGFAGNVLRYGVGISHVFYETNNFAIIPDLEMVNFDFLGGSKTLNGISISSAGETSVNLVTGVRFVFGPKGDLGLFEFGISNRYGTGDIFVQDLVRLDFKFNF